MSQQPKTYSVQQILVSHEKRVQSLEATIKQVIETNSNLQSTINQLEDRNTSLQNTIQQLQDSIQQVRDGIVENSISAEAETEA